MPGEGLKDNGVRVTPIYGFQKKVRHPRKSLGAGLAGHKRKDSQTDFVTSPAELKTQVTDDSLQIYMKKYNKFIFGPNSIFLLIWEALMSICILYCLIVLPFQCAFDSATSFTFEIIDWIIFSFFVIDIIINFRVAYEDNKGTVYEGRSIGRHYIQTWLLFDVIATVPWNIIFRIYIYIIIYIAKIHIAIKLIRLLKIFRLFKYSKSFLLIVKYFTTTAEIMSLFESSIALISFILSLFVCGHLIACLWYSTISMKNDVYIYIYLYFYRILIGFM